MNWKDWKFIDQSIDFQLNWLHFEAKMENSRSSPCLVEVCPVNVSWSVNRCRNRASLFVSPNRDRFNANCQHTRGLTYIANKAVGQSFQFVSKLVETTWTLNRFSQLLANWFVYCLKLIELEIRKDLILYSKFQIISLVFVQVIMLEKIGLRWWCKVDHGGIDWVLLMVMKIN